METQAEPKTQDDTEPRWSCRRATSIGREDNGGTGGKEGPAGARGVEGRGVTADLEV